MRAMICHGPGKRAWEEVPASGVNEGGIRPVVRPLRLALAVG